MVRKIFFLTLALVLVACGASPTATAGFSNSAYTVSPLFAQYYSDHDGALIVGAPISGEVNENGVTVQYYQNAKLEYHPQLPAGSQVILASLGELQYGIKPCVPAANAANTLYFNNCHSVDAAFRAFFEKQGGLAFFGYPISERYIANGLKLAQNFERATIVWDPSKPARYQFGLLPLGSVSCPPSTCNNANDRSASLVVPPASTPTAPASLDPLTRFYLVHGGSRVFGNPVGAARVADDGAREQVYDNAILYLNPAAPEGVSLRPLGLQTLGNPQTLALPLNGPHSGYFARYGHNVSYNAFDFYTANGGGSVFGQPISELQTANGHFVQYFENAVFTIHYNLPPDQIVQLMPLGRQVYLTQSTPVTATSNPQILVITAQALHSVLMTQTQSQTLTARVLDENGMPVVGAQVQFVVHTPAGDMDYASATDSDGYAVDNFTLSSYKSGDFMLYDTVVNDAALTGSFSGSFVTWGAP